MPKLPKPITDMQLVAVRTLTTVLGAPVLSSSTAGSAVTLSWTIPPQNGQSVIAGYRLYKAAAVGGPFALMTTTSAVSASDTLGGSTQFYRVEAFDQYQTGNSSTVISVAPSLAVKSFNPGHGFAMYNYNSTVASNLAFIASLNNPASIQYDPNHFITFCLLFVRWNALEGATAGDYVAGQAMIDQYVNALAAVGRVLCLSVAYQEFSAAGNLPLASGHGCLPAYLDGVASGPYVNKTTSPWSGDLAINAQIDTNAGMDRLIALSAAYAARYNNNPAFEMFVLGETSCGVTPGLNGFSGANYDSQMTNRGVPAFASHWTKSQVRVEYNFTNSGGSAAMPAMFISAAANKITSGGPDIFSTGFDTGADWGLRTRTGEFGGIDYRSTMLHMSEQQERWINRVGYTASIAYNNPLGGFPVSKANYIVWDYQNFGTALTWDGTGGTDSIRAFIHSGTAPVNTVRPPGY